MIVESLISALPPWVTSARLVIAADSSAIDTLFPVAARQVRNAAVPGLPQGWSTADAVRFLLLDAVPETERRSALFRVYGHGDRAERRAVLLSLGMLGIGGAAVPIVADALRTNDTELLHRRHRRVRGSPPAGRPPTVRPCSSAYSAASRWMRSPV